MISSSEPKVQPHLLQSYLLPELPRHWPPWFLHIGLPQGLWVSPLSAQNSTAHLHAGLLAKQIVHRTRKTSWRGEWEPKSSPVYSPGVCPGLGLHLPGKGTFPFTKRRVSLLTKPQATRIYAFQRNTFLVDQCRGAFKTPLYLQVGFLNMHKSTQRTEVWLLQLLQASAQLSPSLRGLLLTALLKTMVPPTPVPVTLCLAPTCPHRNVTPWGQGLDLLCCCSQDLKQYLAHSGV